jgi:hypothetical protein
MQTLAPRRCAREAARDDLELQTEELARLPRALSDADLEGFTHWFDTFYAPDASAGGSCFDNAADARSHFSVERV